MYRCRRLSTPPKLTYFHRVSFRYVAHFIRYFIASVKPVTMSEETPLSVDKNEKSAETLSELFDKAFDLFNDLNKSDESTTSPKIQSRIKQIMSLFEDATRLVSIIDMFSENESFEEVATENIKYFLLPALLGTLTMKICNTDDRMHIVNVAEIYFLDFLKRAKTYGLTDIALPKIKSETEDGTSARNLTNTEMITEMVCRRNTKLQRYQEQKDLESRLDTLKKNLSNLNIDDDIKREYIVTLIKLYVNTSIEELSSLAAEKPILEHMKQTGKTDTFSGQHSQRRKPSAPTLQPIIITRDEAQKKVYGVGYPSLPVLTVQEFYEQRVRDGDWPDASLQQQGNSNCLQDYASKQATDNEQDNIKKEEMEDVDDAETIRRVRAMDEYKDTHRRGWGNRANRS